MSECAMRQTATQGRNKGRIGVREDSGATRAARNDLEPFRFSRFFDPTPMQPYRQV